MSSLDMKILVSRQVSDSPILFSLRSLFRVKQIELSDKDWALLETEEAEKRHMTVQALFDREITPYLKERFSR